MAGWRAAIGYIIPSVIEIVAYDFYRFAPKGVRLVGVTCNIETWGKDEFDKALSQADTAVKYLASRKVDYIIHGGTPPVVTQGLGFDRKLIQRMESLTGGIPCTTSVRTAMDALDYLRIKKVVLVSPYPPDISQATVRYLEANGFQVTNEALFISTVGRNLKFMELPNVDPEDIRKFARQAFEAAPDSDGVLIPCPQWRGCDVADALEKDIGKPVVAGVSAEFWAAFSALNIRDPIKGFGRLLASLGGGRQ